MLSFGAGLYLGLVFSAIIGMLITALCVAAKEADCHIEAMQTADSSESENS